jgi:threonine dehydrogenase-like Zn-dependent dehydrogenase
VLTIERCRSDTRILPDADARGQSDAAATTEDHDQRTNLWAAAVRDAGGSANSVDTLNGAISCGPTTSTSLDGGPMTRMRSCIVTGPGTTDVVEVPIPAVGPRDVLLRMRACGVCGSDALYISYGGIPPRQGATPLGHEPTGEVVEIGAGPIGLGATIAFKLSGAESVVMTDVIPERLATARAVGADAVISPADDDVVSRLEELHGSATDALGAPKVRTDIYLDAAGAPSVIATAVNAAKQGATLGIVAFHKQPVSIDFGALISTELNIATSIGYPTEIFEVTRQIAADIDRFSAVISDRIPFENVQDALTIAATPGTKGKVVVTFDQ